MALLQTRRDAARLLVLALGLAILVAIWPLIPGLLGACALYVLFAPLNRWLARRMWPRVAAGIVLLVVAVVVLVPALALAALLIGQGPAILTQVANDATWGRLATLHVGSFDVGALAASIAGELRAWIPRGALIVFGSMMRTTLNLTLSLFGLYYLLLSGHEIWTRVTSLLPFSAASADSLRKRFTSVTEAMLIGIALTAALQGVIVGGGFWLVGLPNAAFWGAITGLVSVLPVFGSSLVWLPGVVVLALGGRGGAAGALFVIGAGLASNLDNLTRPVVYWRVSHLHPMTTLIGAFAGVAVFGLAGVLLGPLAISYFFELLATYQAEYGARHDVTA